MDLHSFKDLLIGKLENHTWHIIIAEIFHTRTILN